MFGSDFFVKLKDFLFFVAIVCLTCFFISFCPKSKLLVDVYEIPPHFEEDTRYVSVNGVLVPFYVDTYYDTQYKGKYFVVCVNGHSCYVTESIDFDTYSSFKG